MYVHMYLSLSRACALSHFLHVYFSSLDPFNHSFSPIIPHHFWHFTVGRFVCDLRSCEARTKYSWVEVESDYYTHTYTHMTHPHVTRKDAMRCTHV